MDDRAIHLMATYGLMAVEGTITGFIFWQAFSKPMPLRSRIAVILLGIYMLFLTLGSLAGVGTHKRDHYWEQHQAPWPDASIFLIIDAIIFIIVMPILWIVNAIKKWKEPPSLD